VPRDPVHGSRRRSNRTWFTCRTRRRGSAAQAASWLWPGLRTRPRRSTAGLPATPVRPAVRRRGTVGRPCPNEARRSNRTWFTCRTRRRGSAAQAAAQHVEDHSLAELYRTLVVVAETVG